MKKLLFAVTAMTGLMAGGALAASLRQEHPSDAEVNKAIDSRLHAMLVQLNAQKK
jgi:hypothetical protein